MKKFLTLLPILLIMQAVNIQGQSIPNSSFEYSNSDGSIRNWGNVYLTAIWFDSLGVSHFVDSIVYDNQYYYELTNDAFSGNSALELSNAYNYSTNTSIAGAVGVDDDSVFSSWGLFNLIPTYGTPFVPFAPFNFGFYYKYFPVNGDSAFAQITVTDSSGNQLAEGTVLITDSASNYTLITAPINYYTAGDAAFYSLSISNFYSSSPGTHDASFGTRLLVDDIGFNYVSISGLNTIRNDKQFTIYPNPAVEQININSKNNKPIQYKINNMFGQLIVEGTLRPNENTISLNNFKTGVYNIEITSNGIPERQNFIVRK